jgi:predicted phosphatase
LEANNNKQVYILSLEGNDIYGHVFRDKEVNLDYVGMIPHSLELMKVKDEGLSTMPVKTSDKEISNDIINVKFKQKVKSGDQIIQACKSKIRKQDKKIANSETEEKKDKLKNYKKTLEDFISYIESEKTDPEVYKEKWKEIKNDDLREYLYENGFTIKFVDEKTHEVEEIVYKVYRRSSSKSRTGQVLFIREELYDEMIDWSRMYLPFKEDQPIDLASLLAYESLVGSSIEETIKINPNNILVVDDIESEFDEVCNVVKTDKKSKLLDSFKENVKVSNSLFDGQSLLDEQYYDDVGSMKLLRHHFFKSAAFNTNIQQFLEDNCPDDIAYDKWELTDMFGNTIHAKDVHMITTPSSLKCLKFSHVFAEEGDNLKDKEVVRKLNDKMFQHWKQLVSDEGCSFGICKHEKQSKHGTDEEGNILQSLSYQMINCLPLSKDEVAELASYERNYIMDLKENDDHFIKHLEKNANEMNSNQMLVDLYIQNNDIVHTEIFREFRSKEIYDYGKKVKSGKVRIPKADYCVMVGNPYEMLLHSIGEFDIDNPVLTLEGNEVHTKLFDFGIELVGFRNPNTSPSNVLLAKNTDNDKLEQYFNFSKNIVAVNAWEYPLQDTLSGCDYDSDTVLLIDSEKLKVIAQDCKKGYRVCINKLESEKKQYSLNKTSMCEIDNTLAESSKKIGDVVNLGQFCLSTYWDLKDKGLKGRKLERLLKKTDVLTVLSGVVIDLSKKLYKINIKDEIEHIEELPELAERKPKFWQFISESDTIRNRVKYYRCPMDYLAQELGNLEYATKRENVDFRSLLVMHKVKQANRHQQKKIRDNVKKYSSNIKNAYSSIRDEDERNNRIKNIVKYYNFHIEKLNVKEDTMCAILMRMIKDNSEDAIKLLNILHSTQREVFLNAFKSKNSHQ